MKVKNFPFTKKQKISSAQRIGGKVDLDTPPYMAILGNTPYMKDASTFVEEMMPDTGCIASCLHLSVAKRNYLKILPKDSDEPELQSYSGQ